MTADTDKRSGYTAGLRALADALDSHPDIPLPGSGTVLPLSIGFHGPDAERNRATDMAAAARVLMPGQREKAADDGYFRIEGTLHGLLVEVWALREQVCERIVTGTREVTRDVPDPAALAAVPKTTVTETVEDIEWRCVPLLAPGGAA